jgi:hypothetical protein
VLELSALLFGFYGFASVGVGVMLLFVVRHDERSVGLGMFHHRPDTAVFGGDPLPENLQRPFAIFRAMHWHWLAGVLVSFGLLQMAVVVFGLLDRQTWALWVLTFADLAMLPYWVSVLGPYRRMGVRLRLLEIPPILWIPWFVVPVGAVLGWVALR